MAANALEHRMSNTIRITIDDVEVEVPEGELIVEAVKRIGKEVPIFCYHPLLKPVGMCRMCLVELGFRQEDGSVRMMPKPQTACTLPASKGMVVYTETPTVAADRKGVLEFLLINHPLDCPICDKGGECPLQNNTMFYGPSTSRYIEIKRHLPKAFPLSRYVTLDLERCIQCGRCTRFTEEISGDGQLAMLFRGANMQPRTFQMTEFTSKFSGNTIEICPVGALTSTEYRFRARPWDLHTSKTMCTGCSNGCNIWLDHRRGAMSRILGRSNPEVNEDWTCDKGKFGHQYLRNTDRPGTPLIRRGEALVATDWPTVYEEIIRTFETGVVTSGPNGVAGLGGGFGTTEDAYMFQKLFRRGFGSNNVDHRRLGSERSEMASPALAQGRPGMQISLTELERAGSIFVFGSDLSDEAPIVFLRTRKAWFRNAARVVCAHHEHTDAEGFAEVSLRYREGSEGWLIGGLLHQLASRPECDGIQGIAALRESLADITPERCTEQTGVSPEALRRASEALSTGPCAILYRSALEAVEGGLLSLAMLTGGTLNRLLPDAGSHGAMDMGVLPDSLPGLRSLKDSTARAHFEAAWGGAIPEEPGMGTERVLRACAENRIRALFLNCFDPLTDFPDRALAERALEEVDYLVVHHFVRSECVQYASVFLPAQSWADRTGTFTNVEGRVQRFDQALQPIGAAKATWQVCAELLFRMRQMTPPFGPGDIMAEIARLVPAYAECTYDRIGEHGTRIAPHREPAEPAVTPYHVPTAKAEK